MLSVWKASSPVSETAFSEQIFYVVLVLPPPVVVCRSHATTITASATGASELGSDVSIDGHDTREQQDTSEDLFICQSVCFCCCQCVNFSIFDKL